MSQGNSLKGLEKTFQELKSQLDEIDLEAIRNRKQDFPVMPKDELEQASRSKAKTQYKRRLLLTQIGYVRITCFQSIMSDCNRPKETRSLKTL